MSECFMRQCGEIAANSPAVDGSIIALAMLAPLYALLLVAAFRMLVEMFS